MRFDEERMTCDVSRHYAERVSGERWRLSWLPSRSFDRNSAISALTAADELAQPSPRMTLVKALLTDELGLSNEEWPVELDER